MASRATLASRVTLTLPAPSGVAGTGRAASMRRSTSGTAGAAWRHGRTPFRASAVDHHGEAGVAQVERAAGELMGGLDRRRVPRGSS